MQNQVLKNRCCHHFLFSLLLIFTFFGFASCKRNSSSTSSKSQEGKVELTPVKNDRLVLWSAVDPDSLNPVLATDGYHGMITSRVFDTLLTYDIETGLPKPELAESWTISNDGLLYSFKIRPNVLFHDGKPLTAEDVKFTFDSIKNPKVDAAHLQNYYGSLEKVEVKSPLEIQFKMKEPYYRNLIMLGLTEILPKHIYGSTDFNKNPANRAPIGSGPYKFIKWNTGRSIELKRNENYWGLQDPAHKDLNNFNEILIRIITDATVAVMAMKKGDLDEIDPNPTMWVKDFADPIFEQKFYKLKFETEDGNGYRYIGWNLRLPKFQSKKVRQALSMAMPREEINKKIMNNLVSLAVGPFPSNSEKTDPSVKPLPYDLERAKALLAEEGWKDTNGDGILDKNQEKFTFELLFAAGVPENERIALIYQQSLKSLGIEMTIRNLEWTVFLKQLDENKFDSVFMAWGSSLDSDPYQIWHSSQSVKGGSNRIGFKNERVDQILTEARKTLDREKRNVLYREFSRIIADEAPYTFIFQRPNLAIIDKRFEGVLPVGKLGLNAPRWYTPKGREKYSEANQ